MTMIRACLLLSMLGTVAAHGQTSQPRALRGDGSWKTDGEARRAAQQWSLDLQRAADGAVTGSISVVDSPLLSSGRVQGRFDGQLISGSIVDARGQHVARFNGLLTGGRFQGKYTDRTGETGEWEWEGELPE